MNRQPFYLGNQTEYYHYDEDVDRRLLLNNGVTLHYCCLKNAKTVRVWKVLFTRAGYCCGGISNRGGFNLSLWKPRPGPNAEINGLATLDDAIKAAAEIVDWIFP